jgi:hypothetical protein
MAYTPDNGNLSQAAIRAGLKPNQMRQINGLSEALKEHQRLTNLPRKYAEDEFNKLPKNKQQSLVALAGSNKPDEEAPNRSWIESAAHYAFAPVKKTVSTVFDFLDLASDTMTRIYRSGRVAAEEDINFADAWAKAGREGESVFQQDRVAKAVSRYGVSYVNVAKRIAAGVNPSTIYAEAQNEAEKRIASEAIQSETGKIIDPLLRDAVAELNAAKYSPGRDVANAFLPRDLEGKGLLYSWISGAVDATYRIMLDPTLILGKARKIYLGGSKALGVTGKYALQDMVGSAAKVEKYFDTKTVFGRKSVENFWTRYTSAFDRYDKAIAGKNVDEINQARAALRTLEPGLDDDFIQAFRAFGRESRKRPGVFDLDTAKDFLSEANALEMMAYGQPGRRIKLAPRMTPAKAAKVQTLTTGRRVFDLDKDSRALIETMEVSDVDDLLATIAGDVTMTPAAAGTAMAERIRTYQSNLKAHQPEFWANRIDKIKAKFTPIPALINDEAFDHKARTAPRDFYRYARQVLGSYHANAYKEIYAAADLGQRKQMMKGLQATVGNLIGLDKTPGGRLLLNAIEKDEFSGAIFGTIGADGVDPAAVNGVSMALYDFQLSPYSRVIGLRDMQRHAGRESFLSRVLGTQYQNGPENIVDAWTFGTIAGPRFPVRNAIEDYTMAILNGTGVIKTAQARRLSTNIRLGSGQKLGMINRVAKRKDIEYFNTRLKAIDGDKDAINSLVSRGILKKSETDRFLGLTPRQKIEQQRVVMAEAILGQKIDDLANADIADKLPEYIRDFVKYGDLESLTRGAGEGAMNAISGLNASTRASTLSEKTGKIVEIKWNDRVLKPAKTGKPYDKLLLDSQNGRIAYAWNVILRANDEKGQAALSIFDGKISRDKFIELFAPQLDNMDLSEYMRFAMSGDGSTTDMAGAVYDDLKNLFTRSRDGSINTELLNKIRFVDESGAGKVSIREFNLNDLPTDPGDLPLTVAGPEFIEVVETKNIFSDLKRRGWEWLGNSNARFSREPIVVNNAIRIYDDLSKPGGYADDLIRAYSAGAKTPAAKEAAENAARKKVVELSQELALEQTLAFVDNPALRTQLAWSARNFARFYRATEDFYRRLYRTVRYNPEAIQKAALTYEGVTHSGAIDRDQNGEGYFVYPGLNPVYEAVYKVFTGFGVGDNFKIPMPVEFGGKLKMLTPSFDPESWLPTFSGPLAAFPMKMVYSLAPSLAQNENAILSRVGKELQGLERATLGPISAEQTLFQAALPAHVNRLLAVMDRDEREGQYASAFRKAVTYLEAAGVSPSATATPGELKEYQDRLDAAVNTILGIRFVFGFFAPASPSVNLKSDVADWVRNNGQVNMKSVWNDLIAKYNEMGEEDPYGKAMADWVRDFPKQIPFTINESDPNVIPYFQSSNKAAKWVDDNRGLVKKYPQGSAFLIPVAGEFTYDAYSFLENNGYRQRKLVGDFLREVSVATDEKLYYEQKNVKDEALERAFSDRERRAIQDRWETWSREFLAGRPLLKLEFINSQEKAIKRQESYNDLKNMLKNEPNLRGETVDKLRQMVQEYEEYTLAVSTQFNSNSERDVRTRSTMKQAIKLRLEDIATGDQQAVSAFSTLFNRLIGE